MKLSDLKIGTRLYAGFALIVAVLMALVTSAYVNFSSLESANGMNIHTYDVIAEANAMLESLINIETGQRGFSLTGKDASLEPLTAGTQAFVRHLDKTRQLTADNPAQQQRLAGLEKAQQEWMSAAIDPAIARRRAVGTGEATLENVVALEQEGRGKKMMDAMRGMLADIIKDEAILLRERADAASALHDRTSAVLVGGGTVAVLLAAIIATLLARSITPSLRAAVTVARRVASGDLSGRIEVRGRDEVSELMAALRDMNASLVGIVAHVRSGTDTITAASTEIAAGNQDLSWRTEQQAGALEETASSLEELTSTVTQNADNARAASQMANAASAVATEGGSVVAQVVETMSAITEASHKIVDITGVIDGIAFQTNILALNAAVEAARAGEQGRGFAVVAGEVRTLAQRAASAAREIKLLIGQSVEKVDTGSKLVGQAGDTMLQVVASVRRVSDIIGEISAASDEQRAGISQVNDAVSQMDTVTQQNAALVEQAAAAALSMQEQAGTLAEAVGVFVIEAPVFAAGSAAGAHRRPMAALPRQAH